MTVAADNTHLPTALPLTERALLGTASRRYCALARVLASLEPLAASAALPPRSRDCFVAPGLEFWAACDIIVPWSPGGPDQLVPLNVRPAYLTFEDPTVGGDHSWWICAWRCWGRFPTAVLRH